jgi:hypothetical protein
MLAISELSMNTNWNKEVLDLRERAAELQESHPDAALMRCRKAMEAIQHSIFEEKFEKAPEGYIPFEKIMGKKMIGDRIPKPQVIEFNTIQQWGNYGTHYQDDDEPTSGQVHLALGALDNLIAWRFAPKEVIEKTKEFTQIWEHNQDDNEKRNELIQKWKDEIQRTGDMLEFNHIFNLIGKKGASKYSYADRINKINNVIKYINTSSTSAPVRLITRAVELCAGPDGWASLAAVGNKMRDLDSSFKIKKIEYKRLIDLVRAHPDHFELRQAEGAKQTHWLVRNIGIMVVVPDPSITAAAAA